jgi:stage II sporulation protein D (peptidoglycan lytic transglycosylase)
MIDSNRYGRREALRRFALAGSVALWQAGCSQNASQAVSPTGAPVLRVLILENQKSISLSATVPPSVQLAGSNQSQQLRFGSAGAVPITLTTTGWHIGSGSLPRGELHVMPAVDGSVFINRASYHGSFRLVPQGPDHFDVVNNVNIEHYLPGVLPSELFPDWHPEAYKAQAIVARTYGLYEAHTDGIGRYFDVYADQRSQVYNGIKAESAKSRSATLETRGIVVAFGPPGHEIIFKSYFSSCCGGIGQSAFDAFGDPDIPPLRAQNRGTSCAQSPKFNWPAVSIPKAELTRRIRAWGVWKKQSEKDLPPLARIDIMAQNSLGRPVRFLVTDMHGGRRMFRSEALREAINTDANTGPKIFSSFCKTLDDGQSIRFIDGHGYGHGVGMCQWCAQSQAQGGWNNESIVISAFPGARLVRAY